MGGSFRYYRASSRFPVNLIRPIRTLLVANRGEIAIRVIRADRDGEVIEVVARPGQQFDAKDLLVVMA